MSSGTLAVLLAVPVLALAAPVEAQPVPVRPRQVVLVLVEGLSYGRARTEAPLPALSSHGGVGLMTTRVRGGVEPTATAPWVTIGAGAAAGGPDEVPELRQAARGVAVDVAPYREASGSVVPGALGEALRGRGLRAGVITDDVGDARAVLVAMDTSGSVPSFADAEDASEARAVAEESDLIVVQWSGAIAPAGARDLLGALAAREVLVVVAGPAPTPEMRREDELVTAAVVARGSPSELLAPAGGARGLTSATTQRTGIVANQDLAPTILAYLGIPAPAEMTGSPVRVAGAPPDDLHRRYLGYQRVRGPVQVGAILLIVATLVAAFVVALLGARAPAWGGRAAVVLGIAALSLPAVMLVPGSLVSRYTYVVVVPVLVVSAAAVAALALWRRGVLEALFVVGGVTVVVVVLDGAFGERGALLPLLGASHLDGGRYYGLANTYAGVLLGASVLAAGRLGAGAGTALIAATGLYVGLPGMGANIGGAIALFAAAALHAVLRARGRLGIREAVLAGVAVVAGTAVVLLAHRYLAAAPTHAGRFLERAADPGNVLDVLAVRVGINLRSAAVVPAAWLVVLALPAWALVAWRRVGVFRGPLERNPGWRWSAVALGLSGLVGFLVNDTVGVATGSFIFLSGAMVLPAAGERWTTR